MSDIKISEFPTIVGQVTGNEFVPVLQGGVNKKAALSQLGLPILNTAVTPGQYGTADSVASFTVNSYGMLTAASNTFISIAASQITSGYFDVNRGGTGVTVAPANGELLVGNGTGYTLATLTPGTNISITNAAGAITINATDQYVGTVTSVDVSGGTTGLTTSGGPVTSSGTVTLAGTLITSNGGTGLSSYTAGDIVYYAAGDSFSKLSIGTSTHILTSSGSAPQWTDPTNVTVGSASSATNVAGGSANDLLYQSGAGTTTFLNTGTGVLVASGGAPSWSDTPTLSSISLTTGTVSTTPTNATDIANKSYVDTIVAAGVHYHQTVDYEVPDTVGNLNATYNNGTSGVGATLTNAGALAAFAPDGVTTIVGDRILVYNQTNQFENGVYEVTTVGDGATPWVLTRTTDADTFGVGPTKLEGGSTFFVTSGNTGAGETYTCTNVGTITFGVTAITFAQISFVQVYSAGTGLTLTGTTFSLTAPVTAALGGTGQTSYTTGDLLYASSGTTLAKLPGVATGNVLLSGGVGTAPSWGQVGLTTHVTGTLPIANGGTNTTDSPVSGAVAYGTGSAYAFTAAGTAGQVLVSNGTSAPSFGGVDGGTF